MNDPTRSASESGAPPPHRPQPSAADVLDAINTNNNNTGSAIQTLTNTMTTFLTALQPLLAFTAVAASNSTPAPTPASPTPTPAPTRESRLPPGIKPPTPKEYSGNMKDALTWTTATEATLAFANWDMNAPQVVQYAASFLTGRALRWWHGCCNTATASSSPLAASGGFSNWSEFATALVNALGEFRPRDRARDRLYNLRQTSSVHKYTEEFSDLAKRLPNSHWEDLSYFYFKGLKSDVQKLMVGRYDDDATWSDLAALAAHCDDITYNSRSRPRSTPGSYPANPPSSSTATPMDLGNINASTSRRSPSVSRSATSRSPSPAPRSSSFASASASTAPRSGTPARRRPPPLTPEIRAQCLKEGRCFRCREKGHTSDKCTAFKSFPPSSRGSSRSTSPARKN